MITIRADGSVVTRGDLISDFREGEAIFLSATRVSGGGRSGKIVVTRNVDMTGGYEVYEIKTSDSPGDCIREAIGQLLEYGYWPGSPECNEIWIVGPSPIDSQTTMYLSVLRNRFAMPIDYMQQKCD